MSLLVLRFYEKNTVSISIPPDINHIVGVVKKLSYEIPVGPTYLKMFKNVVLTIAVKKICFRP